MTIMIATLNSKYIHSSLSVQYLRSYCKDIFPNIRVIEFTINQSNDYIAGEIFREEPEILALSCYIWNIESTLEIAKKLKMVKPDMKIILGGPEVSFDPQDIMKGHPYIDFIIVGEGEETFKELLVSLTQGQTDFGRISGLVYRDNPLVKLNKPRSLIQDLDQIPSPFDDGLELFKNKIVYYESSRGCPFNCKFCLSSTVKGVRFFSLERVKKDILRLIKAGVKQVKFVDRTFNTSKEYALEIMEFIINQGPKAINFHFEVTAHLIDDEMLKFLEKVPDGLFQFEIGVQSTNPATLDAIDRKTDFERLSYVTTTIKENKNIHQHLDLIAGLPYEDYNSFGKSFNDVYGLSPDKLQLGFLKLLKGSDLREKKEKFGFKYLDQPPYEVFENSFLNYGEMLKLKDIEDLLEKYSNEDGFENTLAYIIKKFSKSPFDFFEGFSRYWIEKGFHRLSHSKNKLYTILYNYCLKEIDKNPEIFNEMIKFDYIYNHKNANLPGLIKQSDDNNLKNTRHIFLKEKANIEKYLPEYKDKPVKKIINSVHFEEFNFDILKYIQEEFSGEPIKVTKILLFVYERELKVFDKCRVYDVTKEFIKMG